MARGLYIHIPFCMKKCAYCDFVSFTCSDREGYISALCGELDTWRGECVDSIFIGGGTPTCLDARLLERLLSYINSCFKITSDCEWSTEANPKTVDSEKLEILRAGGVNRLSVGVQSFSDSELARTGRVHNADEAAETLELVGRYFDNFNIDIISALPGQSIESFSNTIDRALSFSPSHISCYSLILEEGTPLFEENERAPLNLPDEDSEREMYALAQIKLEKAGYRQYEISNFAKPNRECRHNLKYWHCEEYIGAGLAAHSYIGGTRIGNTTDMKSYLAGNRTEEKITLSGRDMRAEFIIMALRLAEGVSTAEYTRRFGRDFAADYSAQLDKFIKLNLIEKTPAGFRLTERGISVSNSVMCEFV